MFIIVHHVILKIAKITLVLVQGLTYGISGRFGAPEKNV